MPTYRFRCHCGVDFEAFLQSWSRPNPGCPGCGDSRALQKLPTSVALLGARPSRAELGTPPSSWEGTHSGDRDYVTHWRRALESRTDRDGTSTSNRVDAVCAHEGSFANNPLTYRELADRTARVNGDVVAARADAAAARRVGSAGKSNGSGAAGTGRKSHGKDRNEQL